MTVDAEAELGAADAAAEDDTFVVEGNDGCGCACVTPKVKTQVQATAKATTSDVTQRFMIFSKARSA
jgi:hypothetical protein